MTSLYIKLFFTVLIVHDTVQERNKFVQFREENMIRQRQALFMKTVLKLYSGFSLMFHTENDTSHSVDHLLKIIEDDIFGEVVILNQDTLGLIDFQQRKGSPFLHLVMLSNPKKYAIFLDLPGCLISRDVVIFVIYGRNNTLDEKFWTMPRLNWAGNVIILSVSEMSLSIFNVCYYCGKLTKKLNHLHTSNYSKIDISKVELLPRNFKNFHKYRFKIGYIDSFPYMWCEHSSDIKENDHVFRKCNQASGLEIGMLSVLQEKLNFTYLLIEYGYSLSKSDQDINKDGSKKLDFIIGGISITAARAPKMSFTSAFAFEPYTFLYIPRKSKFAKMFDNLKPFQGSLWITVSLTTFWFSLSLYFSIRLISNKRYFSFLKCLKICFKPIIEQTENVCLHSIRAHFSPYLVLMLWWFASTIFVTAYKSKLWAISIKSHQVEPSNLQELLDNGYEIVINSQNMDIIEDILNDTEPMILEARRNLVLKNRTCGALSYALTNKAAMLDEYATVQYHALVRCSAILQQAIYSKLRITKVPLRHTPHSWALEMGAPYKYAFDTLIARIEAAGLKRKWKSDSLSILRDYDAIPYSQTASTENVDEDGKFLQGLTSPFTFHICGNFLAFLCFVLEIIYKKILTSNK